MDWANWSLEEIDSEMFFKSLLPLSKARTKKLMPGGKAREEPITNAEKKFEVEVHSVVLETCINASNTRFSDHGKLATDFLYFDPENFPHILEKGIAGNALENFLQLLGKFCDVSSAELRSELIHFATFLAEG